MVTWNGANVAHRIKRHGCGMIDFDDDVLGLRFQFATIQSSRFRDEINRSITQGVKCGLLPFPSQGTQHHGGKLDCESSNA